MGSDAVIGKECRFCGVTIREGDDLDSAATAHVACVDADRRTPSDGERLRRIRQLWKLAKS